jgi:hypothetical protein
MLVFSEKQKFRQWWLWLPLVTVSGFMVYGIYQQIILKKPFGDNPANDTVLLLISLVPLIILVLFMFSELETEISDRGVSYKFFPFHWKSRTIVWGDIEKAFIRKYRPIIEYGGWGLRLGIFGNGRLLSVSGNMGLQLILKSGKRLLLGTRKPEELEKVIKLILDKKS